MVQKVISHDNTARMLAGHQALIDALVQLADLDQLADIFWQLHAVQSSEQAFS